MKIKLTLAILILFTFLLQSSSFDHFRFSRNIQCAHQDKKGYCDDWDQSTILYSFSNYIFYCFPADLYVQTSKGPLKMKDLTTQDSIFSLNLQTGKHQFSPIVAWLHRDPSSLFEYNQIEIKDSKWKYLSSQYHNIAFANQDQTDFKFLKDLKQGDTLITLTAEGEDFQVGNTSKKIQKEGLYSPFTQTGTFYIYPDNFDSSEHNQKSHFPMILVHSLSQIKNPAANFNLASKFLATTGAVFGHYQPTEDEEYVNPMISQFSLIFSSDWVDVSGQKISHKWSEYNSYSATRNRKQQEQKKKTMVILAVESILADTLL